MGTSQSAVARLERGDADLRLSTLRRYAAALDRRVGFGLSGGGGRQRLVTTPPDRPYIPYPFPPYREPPERKEPLLVPIVYEPAGRDPVRRLYERRTVLLGRGLDSGAATDVAAELMSLDGRSGQSIELLVNSPGGPIEDVFAVLDVIALLRAPVTVTCFGRALGTAAVLLASGTGPRRATPNTTISLRCPPAPSTVGSAQDAEQPPRSTSARCVTASGTSSRSGPGFRPSASTTSWTTAGRSTPRPSWTWASSTRSWPRRADCVAPDLGRRASA